jgi:ABC-type glycerol-3-phosphate transport system substrate-binding protein
MKQKIFLILILTFVTGCNLIEEIGSIPGTTPVPGDLATPTGTPTLTPEATLAPGDPIILRIWIPPQFNPDPETTAGQLFQNRLSQFRAIHPEVEIQVRIKAEAGPGGLLESLQATRSVAPATLPDLVLLPQRELQNAARLELLLPLNETLFATANEDWYDFALELGTRDGESYGVPFVLDALTLFYRPEFVEMPPRDWNATLNLGQPFLFAVASPDANFSQALYLAAGAETLDPDGHPSIQPNTLTTILTFYRNIQLREVLPAGAIDLNSEDDVYQAYLRGEANAVITWLSYYLAEPNEATSVAGIPTVSGSPYTLVTGWSWGIGKTDETNRDLRLALARFLSASDFLAAWSDAAGYFPSRPSALDGWPESNERAIVSQLTLSAHPFPGVEVQNIFGPVFQEATLAVLRDGVSPTGAANAALDQGETP